ncbi:hypothetical protein Hanom_Chr02g00139931 [Helianthus anomalus]
MGDSIHAGSNREEIERMQVVHVVREAENREWRLKRREMTESEIHVVVTAEEEQLNQFMEGLFADPEESSERKSPAHKIRKTGEGSSEDVQAEPTAPTWEPPPPAPT